MWLCVNGKIMKKKVKKKDEGTENSHNFSTSACFYCTRDKLYLKSKNVNTQRWAAKWVWGSILPENIGVM